MKTWKVNWEVWKKCVKASGSLFLVISPIVLLGVFIFGLAEVVLNAIKGSLDMHWLNCFIIFVILIVIYLPIWYKIATRIIEKDETERKQKQEQAEEKRLKHYETQYSHYVSLVQSVAKEYSKECLSMVKTKDYLLKFGDYLNWLNWHGNIVKPNSFIEATCLIYSFLEESTVNQSETIDFAIKCALEIISEPVAYWCNQDGEWLAEKYRKTNILPTDDLMKKIKASIVNDFAEYWIGPEGDVLHDVRIAPIMQMADLLHLIYSRSCNK